MGFIIDLYKYFAKFPVRSAIDEQYTNKGADFSYAAWNTLRTTLQADIPNFSEELITDIKHYFFGSELENLKKPKFNNSRDLFLIVNWSEIENERNDFDARQGVCEVIVTLVYQYSEKSFTGIESAIIDDQINEILLQIESQMHTDSKGVCPIIIKELLYPFVKIPIEFHNWKGISMITRLGTKKNAL